MGLLKKAVTGAAKGAWKLGTRDNLTPSTGGGLTSAVITKQINPLGFAALGLGTAAIGIAGEGFAAANRRLVGQVSYQDGPTRMVSSHTTGAIPAMMRASKGDYQAFAGMAKDVLSSPGLLNKIDDFGANSEMIAALYGMGGN